MIIETSTFTDSSFISYEETDEKTYESYVFLLFKKLSFKGVFLIVIMRIYIF